MGILASAGEIAGIATAVIAVLSLVYAIITKMIVGPMIKNHIAILFDKIDDRYISRKEILLMQQAQDETHKRTAREIRDIWNEINDIKRVKP